LDGVKERGRALVLHGRTRADRDQCAAGHALAQAGDHLLRGQRAFFQIFFHQLFAALGDVLDGDLTRHGHFVGEVFGHVDGGQAASFVKGIGFFGQNIDESAEIGFAADGQEEHDRFDAQGFGQTLVGHLKIGAFAVHLVDEDQGREIRLDGFGPYFLGQGLDPVNGVEDQDDIVRALQEVGQIADEIVVTGRIDEEIWIFLPGELGETGLDAAPAFDFFGFVVQNRGAFVYFAKPGDGTGGVEQHFGY